MGSGFQLVHCSRRNLVLCTFESKPHLCKGGLRVVTAQVSTDGSAMVVRNASLSLYPRSWPSAGTESLHDEVQTWVALFN